MKRNTLIILLSLVSMIVVSGLAHAEDYTIIGAKKCSMCHKAKTGDQDKIWTESKHAGAFETLKSEASAAIAKEKGLGNAWEAAECLVCHDTKAFLGAELDAKTKYDPAEGVSCEACHNAGSGYKSKKIMMDHDASVAAGMNAAPMESCVKCHNENSPTFKGFELEARWAEIAHPVPAE
jgi:Cytochrome c554 and c-prime